MVFSKSTALELCALNLQAYSLATTGRCALPAGYTQPIAIRMPAANRPFFLNRDPLDIWGFASSKDSRLYLVFRGTEITSGFQFGQEWCEDALSLPLEPFGAGHVHLGFYGAWKALRDAVFTAAAAVGAPPANGKVITGHSLGAALATLCWADPAVNPAGVNPAGVNAENVDLMTFASPRVGDPAFATALWNGQTVRIINAPDIVPDVPTDPPFRHGGYQQKVEGPGSALDRVLAHNLNSYAAGLEKC